ncbi:hypothetical protein ACOMHN_055374 [Nucella lapillus]
MEDLSPTLPALLLNDSWNDSTTAGSYGEITEAHYSTFTISRVKIYLQSYLYAIIFVSGVFGNIMTITIMQRVKSGESTINIYFTAVAAMDLMMLCVLTLPSGINYLFNFKLNATHDVVCKISTWLYTGGVKKAGKFLSKGDSEQAQAREKAARSVTVTVIAVSITFLVLTLPGTINYILFYFERAESDLAGYRQAVLGFINVFCECLFQANTAINFYLYCLTGRRFREEFIKIMCCGRNRRQRGAYQ